MFHDMDTLTPAADTTDAAGVEKGTQAIRRASAMLKAIAKAGADGATLAELARAVDLPRSTAHRILKCLESEGFVAQSGTAKRYQMGPLVQELGLASTSSATEIARWRQVIDAVARRTGVTAYLMRRSGVEAVCLAKADGQGVIRFVPVEVGERRLLGVGAGATALLAALAPRQVEEVIRSMEAGLSGLPRITPASLRAAVDLVRRTGFAMSQGTVVEDGFGMGMAVPNGDTTPYLAVSVAAHAAVVTESTLETWRRVIREEIQAALRDGGH